MNRKPNRFPAFHRLIAILVLLGAAVCARPAGAAGPSRRSPHPPEPGLYIYEDLTSVEAARLNRDSTIVLQPIGMIHPHGPHLPAGTDNLIVNALVRKTAERLRADRTGFGVLVMPLLPIGVGPANEMGFIFNHPATATVSRRVFEAALVDWSLNFATNSWRNFYFLSFHHDPSQMKIVTDVSEFLHDGYGMRSGNLTSLVLADSAFRAAALKLAGAPKDTVELVFDLHGGAAETSLLLAVAPEKVGSHSTQPDVPVGSWQEKAQTAQRMAWPYYFGNPALANAEYGRNLLDLLAAHHARLIASTMADPMLLHTSPYLEDVLKKEFGLREIVRSSEAYEVKSHQKYQAWLKARHEKEPPPSTSGPGGSNR
jgi:creatinine amidohydrolase